MGFGSSFGSSPVRPDQGNLSTVSSGSGQNQTDGHSISSGQAGKGMMMMSSSRVEQSSSRAVEQIVEDSRFGPVSRSFHVIYDYDEMIKIQM